MKVNIAGGTGIMGSIHKPLFENEGHEVVLSGRSTTPSLEEAAKSSDLTIISVPIPATTDMIKRVAPYANALMDFTGLKQFPIEAMLKYSRQDSEVGGLHPLYGNVKPLEGRTVVYCSTERSGEKCQIVVDTFRRSGLKIINMCPKDHDLIVGGVSQNARIILFETFGLLMDQFGITAKQLYELAPPPTRILLDLMARQADEKKDELYQAMRRYNPSTRQITQGLADALESTGKNDVRERIRKLFGHNLLKEAQDRANSLIKRQDK